jgi:tetratricopeptide (TPR) repeat protein
LLGEQKFDLAFVDGDHSYSSALNDIENSAPLVAEAGVICGDDLELQIHQLDVQHARENNQKDYVMDPKTQSKYHPGVSLAVGEFFGEVSAWEGFWAMRKRNGRWEKVELHTTTVRPPPVPEHLTEQRGRNYLQFGEQLFKAGRIAEAQKVFLRARALAPDSAEVHKALAVVCWKLDNRPQAIAHMQRVFQLHPRSANVKENYDRAVGTFCISTSSERP